MKAEQIVFPFRIKKKRQTRTTPNLLGLVGRSYLEDRYVEVTVTGVCAHDSGRVMVRRHPGTEFSMPGWLVASIFTQEQKKRKRAA